MRVIGSRKLQRALQRDLPWRRGKQIGAANDLRHALFGVIDDYRQLIREWPIGALDDKVARRSRDILLDASCDDILECDDRIRRPKTDRASGTTSRQAVATRAGIYRLGPERSGGGTLDVRATACAFVSKPPLAKLRERGVIQMRPSRLPHDIAVPFEAISPERFENFLGRSRSHAWTVEIFDPHEPPPSARPREQPRSDGGNQTAEMEGPGRRRSEAAVQRGSEP